MHNTMSAAQQVEALNARLLHLFVQRDNLKAEVEKTETEIAAVRNLIGGVQLGREVEREAAAQAAPKEAPEESPEE